MTARIGMSPPAVADSKRGINLSGASCIVSAFGAPL